MARYEELIWQGSPTGQTRRDRTACPYRAYVPDPLAARSLALPASGKPTPEPCRRDIAPFREPARPRRPDFVTFSKPILEPLCYSSPWVQQVAIAPLRRTGSHG